MMKNSSRSVHDLFISGCYIVGKRQAPEFYLGNIEQQDLNIDLEQALMNTGLYSWFHFASNQTNAASNVDMIGALRNYRASYSRFQPNHAYML